MNIAKRTYTSIALKWLKMSMTGKATASKNIKMALGIIMYQYNLMVMKRHRYLMTGNTMRNGIEKDKKYSSKRSTLTSLINQLGNNRALRESRENHFRASLIIEVTARKDRRIATAGVGTRKPRATQEHRYRSTSQKM